METQDSFACMPRCLTGARDRRIIAICAALVLTVLARQSAQASQSDPAHSYLTSKPHADKVMRTAALSSPNERLWEMQSDQEVPLAPEIQLSPAALQVSRIAGQNGDKHFVMVDKVRGKLILFHDGKPAFIWPALTGESIADRLPEDAVYKPVSQQVGIEYKVTPAGRFTMSRGYDDTLGATLDINELQGRDWVIAIHRVTLGQHRDARLRSLNDEDKHITEGCIDVDPNTVSQLLRHLPNSGRTPLYILQMMSV